MFGDARHPHFIEIPKYGPVRLIASIVALAGLPGNLATNTEILKQDEIAADSGIGAPGQRLFGIKAIELIRVARCMRRPNTERKINLLRVCEACHTQEQTQRDKQNDRSSHGSSR